VVQPLYGRVGKAEICSVKWYSVTMFIGDINLIINDFLLPNFWARSGPAWIDHRSEQ
jgi:hypothetical protein